MEHQKAMSTREKAEDLLSDLLSEGFEVSFAGLNPKAAKRAFIVKALALLRRKGLSVRKRYTVLRPRPRRLVSPSDAWCREKWLEVKRLLAQTDPKLSSKEIAILANVSSARVSETTRGDWDHFGLEDDEEDGA